MLVKLKILYIQSDLLWLLAKETILNKENITFVEENKKI